MSCIICLCEDATFHAKPCGHPICCHSCAIQMETSGRLVVKCPTCRGELFSITGKCKGPMCIEKSDLIDLKNYKYPECDDCMKYSSLEKLSFEQRKFMDKKFRNYDAYYDYNIQKFCKTIDSDDFTKLFSQLNKCKFYNVWYSALFEFIDSKFFKYTEGFASMFSVAQTEFILSTLNGLEKIDYRIYNALTRLCIYPWKLGKAARHGICYYGNFGETPNAKESDYLFKNNYTKYIGNVQCFNHWYHTECS